MVDITVDSFKKKIWPSTVSAVHFVNKLMTANNTVGPFPQHAAVQSALQI